MINASKRGGHPNQIVLWCKRCHARQKVEIEAALAHGLPKCCGLTMGTTPPALQIRARRRLLNENV
jgi:hypothetical protein